jgi:hypothetical protein
MVHAYFLFVKPPANAKKPPVAGGFVVGLRTGTQKKPPIAGGKRTGSAKERRHKFI